MTDLTTHDGVDATLSEGVSQGLVAGSQVGRYRIEHRAGAGAMGVVYAARDGQLDRTVALKILNGGTGRELVTRLRREAQALARLNHPNVVEVLDTGTYEDCLFIAMEFIQGVTLRRWLAEPRGYPEILPILVQAGRGLAAAHGADLVHRDFKPDNVMIDDNLRVRVMDFGLARTVEVGQEQTSSLEHDVLGVDLTRTGALSGTPAYCSPEQFSRAELAAASDQFSFCVVAFEALYGVRPFEGNTVFALGANVCAGQVRDVPSDATVPAPMLAILRRGLSADPKDRFATMDDLLAELERFGQPRRSLRGTIIAALAVAAALVGTVIATTNGHQPTAEPALDEPATVAELDPALQARVDTLSAELATLRQYDDAAGLFAASKEVGRLLKAAEALGHGPLTAEVAMQLGLLLGTRAESEASLAAYEKAYFEADRHGLHALAAAAALELSVATAAAHGSDDAGLWRSHCTTHLQQLDPAAFEGHHGLKQRGRVAHHEGEHEASVNLYRRAAALVEEDDRNERGQLRALEGQALEGMRRHDDARKAYVAARSDLVAALGETHPRVAGLDYRLGELALITGHHDASTRHLRNALATWERGGDGTALRSAKTRSLLAAALLGLDRQAEAISEHRIQIELLEKARGTHDVSLVLPLSNLALAVRRSGEPREALALYQRARAIGEAELGADHIYVARIVGNIATTHSALGETEQALRYYERALASHQAQRSVSPDIAYVLSGLGLLLLKENRPADAVPHLRRAIEVRLVNEIGPLYLGYSRFDLARALRDTGEDAEARKLAEQALADLTEADPSDAAVVELRTFLGRVSVARLASRPVA